MLYIFTNNRSLNATIILLLIVTLLIPISFNGSASILQPQPTPPPVQAQSIPQQIPGNDTLIVENDTRSTSIYTSADSGFIIRH